MPREGADYRDADIPAQPSLSLHPKWMGAALPQLCKDFSI